MNADSLKVALVQMAPIWLHRQATIDKILLRLDDCAAKGAQLAVFGEGLLPGYPFWLEHTGGAAFENRRQKDWYAHYVDQAVDLGAGHLNRVCQAARQHRLSLYLGIIERAPRRGDSLYASLVHVDRDGQIVSVHRKLRPTHEERLAWSQGDGNGLKVHPMGRFMLGGLNCWENWMPLARSSLYAQGENVHIAVWPGNRRNTQDITRFIARELRGYVISVSGLLQRDELSSDLPHHADLLAELPEVMANGGSCVAAPDGSWLLEPQTGEAVFTVELQRREIDRARQSFNPVGHYARPDVFDLRVDCRRQGENDV